MRSVPDNDRDNDMKSTMNDDVTLTELLTEFKPIEREQLIECLVGDVSCKYGAPMGRHGSNQLEPDLTYSVVEIPIFEGYDQGGAYWGMGMSLFGYVAITDDDEFVGYGRHEDFADAAEYLRAEHNAKAVECEALPCYDLSCECSECGHEWHESDWRESPKLDCPMCDSSKTTSEVVV